jgi:hypothetical protein
LGKQANICSIVFEGAIFPYLLVLLLSRLMQGFLTQSGLPL